VRGACKGRVKSCQSRSETFFPHIQPALHTPRATGYEKVYEAGGRRANSAVRPTLLDATEGI